MQTQRTFTSLVAVALVAGVVPAGCFAASESSAQSATPPGVVASEVSSMYFNLDGRCYELSVTDQDLRATPTWNTLSLPPLSSPEAAAKSRTELLRHELPTNSFRLASIHLEYNTLADRWFYVIGWRPTRGGYRGDNFEVAVLMNGVVLPTTVTECPPNDSEVQVEH